MSRVVQFSIDVDLAEFERGAKKAKGALRKYRHAVLFWRALCREASE